MCRPIDGRGATLTDQAVYRVAGDGLPDESFARHGAERNHAPTEWQASHRVGTLEWQPGTTAVSPSLAATSMQLRSRRGRAGHGAPRALAIALLVLGGLSLSGGARGRRVTPTAGGGPERRDPGSA